MGAHLGRLTVLLAVLLAAAPRPEPSPAIPGASSQSSISIDTSEDATGTLATARTGAPTAQGTRAETAVRFPSQYPRGEYVSLGAPLIALGQGALTTGHASWYADPRKPQGSLYAAMPGYRWGHPYWVTVRYGSRSLRVRVSDFCQCHLGRRDAKVIDLSWRAFVVLTRLPLSRGIARVEVSR